MTSILLNGTNILTSLSSVKLILKERVGSKIIKKHDKPKTPNQRLMESEYVDQPTKGRLKEQFESLNPFELQKRMASKIIAIINLVNENRCDELSTYPHQFTKEERKKEPKKERRKLTTTNV